MIHILGIPALEAEATGSGKLQLHSEFKVSPITMKP